MIKVKQGINGLVYKTLKQRNETNLLF